MKFTDSKWWKVLSRFSDLVILNVLYLLCSLPIVTNGAAQAGLYTAIRAMQDEKDETPPAKAFFKGFRSGLWRISFVSTLFLALAVVTFLALIRMIGELRSGGNPPFWVAMIALPIELMVYVIAPAFHARFDCGPLQLLRNSLIMTMSTPFKAILIAFLNFLPLVIAYGAINIFVVITPVFLFLYYSLVALLAHKLLRKPFGVVEAHIHPQQSAEEK